MKNIVLDGAFTAMVTPFANGKVDEVRLREHVEFQISSGIRGLVPCGTTGESATLSHDEHQFVIETVIQAVAGRALVIAGTGSNSTEEAIRLTRHAESVGADAALLISPYYNRPTQEGLFQHYKAISESVDLPLIPYTIQSRTGVNIEAETVARLSELKNIVGIKEASGNLAQMSQIIHMTRNQVFTLLSGDDMLTLPVLSIGGRGIISVLSNIMPREVVKIVDFFQHGKVSSAIDLHYRLISLIDTLFIETNPVPIKTAMGMLGRIDPGVRLPLCAMSKVNVERIGIELVRVGLL